MGERVRERDRDERMDEEPGELALAEVPADRPGARDREPVEAGDEPDHDGRADARRKLVGEDEPGSEPLEEVRDPHADLGPDARLLEPVERDGADHHGEDGDGAGERDEVGQARPAGGAARSLARALERPPSARTG